MKNNAIKQPLYCCNIY